MKKIHYGWLVMLNGTLVVLGALGLARFGYTLVLPSMQAGLGMENTQAGALATANLIGYLALSLLGGALAVRFGPRLVIAVGLLLAAAGMVFTGLSGSVLGVAAWRALTGIGSGASNVPVMGLLAAWFSKRRRGLATGVASVGSSIALIALGPTVPLALGKYGDNGWRVCWFLFGGATAVIAVLSWLILRNRPSELGLSPIGESGNSGNNSSPKTGAPRWGDVYRSGAVWHLGLVYIAFGFSYIIYMTFFFKHLISAGGYSREAAGALFMMVGWLSLFCGLIWGAISDAIGRKAALIMVYCIQGVSFALFGLWTTPAGFTVSAALFGITAWSIPAIMAAACGDTLGPELAPAALGFITVFFGIGQAAGPSVAGAIADLTGSFHPAFLLAGGVAFLGALGAGTLPGQVQAEVRSQKAEGERQR
ncbi:MAG: MFS transporter [Candidatus Latescibacterota bacterium]